MKNNTNNTNNTVWLCEVSATTAAQLIYTAPEFEGQAEFREAFIGQAVSTLLATLGEEFYIDLCSELVLGWHRTTGAIYRRNEINHFFAVDSALPQQWLDWARARLPNAYDPYGHVGWGYPDGTILGVPVPRTAKGMVILGMLAS